VGIHSFGSMPSKIAIFLKLENPTQYTGHCFRRSSATVLAGHGADITTLKRHGGWKSTTVAEGYIEHSHHYVDTLLCSLNNPNLLPNFQLPSPFYNDGHILSERILSKLLKALSRIYC